MESRQAVLLRKPVKHRFAHVSEGGMSKVMPQRDGFREVLVEAQRARYGTRDLRYLKGMGEPCPVVVSLRQQQYLRFVFKPAE